MIVGERFEVVREAGSGGMGVVYEAIDQTSGRRVAVKVLGDRAHALRFAREAEVLSQLQHPGIVGYVAHGEGYLAMEWLEGEDLATRLEDGRFSVDEAVMLVTRIADAIGTAHARGIVHRDLKPSNVYLVEGRVDGAKVLDFGLARDSSSSAGRRPLTATGTVMGSVGYLAPEQARGSPSVDARADVFALGCILYECLTGEPAFTGGHAVAILAKLLVEDAPRVRTLRPEVPPALEQLVARMLARGPDHRPNDGAVVRDALLRIADASSVPRPSIVPTSLGRDEQRMMSVILVGEPHAGAATDSSRGGATVVSLRNPDGQSTVEAAAAAFDANVAAAADGTLVVTLRGGGGTDQAVRAGRCALALRAACPGAVVALALGRGATSGEGPVAGEVIERAASLFAVALRHPSDAIFVEGNAVPLLESHFLITQDARGVFLDAERNTSAAARVLLGRVTPFVGRAREMTALEQAFASAIVEREASAVVVVGAPGSGKSRLREELAQAAKRRAPDVAVHLAQGDAQRLRYPFAAAAAIVRSICGVDERAPAEAQQAAIAARTSEDRVAAFLAEMMGAPMDDTGRPQLRAARQSVPLMHDHVTRAWVDFLGAELARGPRLFVLDDLQWIDPPTVHLFDQALGAHRDQPLVVVAFGRPEALEAFPAVWGARGAQTLHLAPLSARAAERLVRQALPDCSETDMGRLVERAAGNPFVLEELVRARAERPHDDALPDGVLALVQARLETLDASLRRVLRAASVFGRTARAEGVARLLGDEGAIELVHSSIRVLVGHEMLETVLDDPGLVRFRHDLMRDATYATLTDADRRAGHALAAGWLEEAGEQDASVLAMHWELAGDAARAVAWHVRAAEQAVDGNAAAMVNAHVDRALALGADGELRGRALLARALATRYAGDAREAFDDAAASVGCFTPGDLLWLQAALTASTLADMINRRDAVHRYLDAAMALAPADRTARGLRARILASAVMSKYHEGDSRGAGELVDRLVVESEPLLDDPAVALAVHRARAARAGYDDDPFNQLTHWIEARRVEAESGNRRGEAIAYINIGYSWLTLGRYQEAEAALRQAIPMCAALGMVRGVAGAEHNLGLILGLRGEYAEATRMEERAIAALEPTHESRIISGACVYLATIHEMAGDLEAAESCARRALREVELLPPGQPRALVTLARLLMKKGRMGEAAELGRRAQEILGRCHLEGGEVQPRVGIVETLLGVGRVEEARAHLRELKPLLDHAAARIEDAEIRRAFLEDVPENARALALFSEHDIA